jgi:hypothetical protein
MRGAIPPLPIYLHGHTLALWDFRFLWRRVLRWPSSGLLRRVKTHCPDDGGNNHLWNVGKLVPDYTAQQSRKQPSSCFSFVLKNFPISVSPSKWETKFHTHTKTSKFSRLHVKYKRRDNRMRSGILVLWVYCDRNKSTSTCTAFFYRNRSVVTSYYNRNRTLTLRFVCCSTSERYLDRRFHV